jgi:hypothetical protein
MGLRMTVQEAGRLGGLRKVTKGVGVLSKEQRVARARAAAEARWAKYRKENVGKEKAA